MKGEDFYLRMATTPPWTRLHPRLGEAFRQYLAGEKAVSFGSRLVVNTHFPPYPSRAFDHMADQFLEIPRDRRLYSVTLAVTNRCSFNCWHCYNAGRDQRDVPLDELRNLAGRLQDLGAVMIDLTGGEPLLRQDLEGICRSFDDRSCLIIGTTGWGLTPSRAQALREAGAFGIGISLDSADESEHDRLRGREGAFRAALRALDVAAGAGLYPYVVSVATREFLSPNRFMSFMDFAANAGAREVHLLEPCPAGRLAGRSDVVLTAEERSRIVEYQHDVARREDLPILSTFTYLEGEDAFGCGAGLTHLYVDGSGELCPCNLVPLSFGNVTKEPLEAILDRMGRYFLLPRPSCVGRILTPLVGEATLPTPPDVSCSLCEQHLPKEHPLPKLFRARQEAHAAAGKTEVAEAYDHVHADYDQFWLSEAGKPVEDLVRRLHLRGSEHVFEAGCGSGFGTALLAKDLRGGGSLTAVDISGGMLEAARRRLNSLALQNVRFKLGDAAEVLAAMSRMDVVFSSWVLGYIPVAPFFATAAGALVRSGRLAFVVHRENSPRRESEIFVQLIARDPSVLLKQVAFDFPRDARHVRELLAAANLEPEEVWEGSCVFRYGTAEGVLEHLLKSGAGTVFYEAVDPARRKGLTQEFLKMVRKSTGPGRDFEVRHDYVACVARKP